jgi:hypothetical protein
VHGPRTVVLTSAGAAEQSHAAEFSNGVWHADEFSLALASALADGSLSERQVWRRVAAATAGSHVQFAARGVRAGRLRPLG